MAESFENIIQVFKSIPTSKKISFVITFSLLIVGFVALLYWTNRPDYQVLFSNLDTGDAAKITEKLGGKGIPFQLKDGGTAVLVPRDEVYQLRLDMASEGLPKGNTVGFEIFDDMSFGTTEFVQKMRYQQAIQGELARTIMEFDAIDQARVHIVASGDSLFAEPEKPATASVVIRPSSGLSLDKKQLQGIINLVACAVEGLKQENVTVVDMAGGLLSNGEDPDNIGDISSSQFDYRKKIEDSYEKQIQTMLEPVVGVNKVVARVSADIDFRKVNISEETYDPDNVVIRSEQIQKESSTNGGNITSGSPDLKYKLSLESNQGATSSTTNFEKENSVVNYEINKVNKQIIDASGDIKRLSAAVIIDGAYETAEDANGNESQQFVGRDRREMKTFEDIVKKAIGFDEERGDQVTVSNIAFNLQKNDHLTSLPESSTSWFDNIKSISKPLINIVLVIFFLLIAIKPLKKWLNQTGEYVASRSLPREGALSEGEAEDAQLEIRKNNKMKFIESTKENPDVTADILRNWMNEVS